MKKRVTIKISKFIILIVAFLPVPSVDIAVILTFFPFPAALAVTIPLADTVA